MSTSREQIVRIGRIAGGVCLSLAGLILLILPGPGIPLLLAGLLLLERDFHWAGRLRRRLVRWLKAVLDVARRASIAARLWFRRLRLASDPERV